VGFDLSFSAAATPQIYTLDRAATGTGFVSFYRVNIISTSVTLLLKKKQEPKGLKIDFSQFSSH
jgi:hypothetical protein